MNFLSQLVFSVKEVSTSKKMVESYVFVAIIAGSIGYVSSSFLATIVIFSVLSLIWLFASTSIFMMSARGKQAYELENANQNKVERS